MDTRDQQRAWLQQVLQITGLAPTTLAKEAGLTPTTLTRFLNNPEHATALSHRTITAVEKSTGVSYGAQSRPRLLYRADAETYPSDDRGELADRIRAIVTGNSLAPWTIKSRALEAAGYLPGDVLIVDLNGTPEPGDVVCAQIYDFKSMRAETMFRLYEPPFLYAATLDRLQGAPTLIDASVGIKGPVVLSIRGRAMRREAA